MNTFHYHDVHFECEFYICEPKRMNQYDIQTIVDRYNRLHNTCFDKVTDRYSLFPQDGEYGFIEHDWPNIGKSGVYFVLDEDEKLVYVGQTRDFGKRLWDHFHNLDNCDIEDAYYIYTTACKIGHEYERLSFEAFLIERFNPKCNKKRE